jgi:hypothetical protein
LIPTAKYNELTTLLQYLRTRKEVSSSRPQTAFSDRMRNMLIDGQESEMKVTEEAVIDKLDQYIELLYEDLADKIKASFLILKLSKNSENLIELTTNETLICALARVLREDGKKSLELAINIAFIFACFSNYSQFHSTISQVRHTFLNDFQIIVQFNDYVIIFYVSISSKWAQFVLIWLSAS